MKSSRNVIFLILAAMVLFCQVSFADSQGMETKTEDTVAVVLDTPPDGYTKEEIDAKLAQIRDAVPVISNRYSNDEIDAKLAEVKGAIPDVSDNYTNEEIDDRIAAVENSIPAIPDVYSKEEIKVRIRAINDAISNLEIALANIRNSIPAEIKWPVKTKKILTEIRVGIPADIARTRE
ncbi:MAG: hypothetical protein ACYST3_03005 [Planctomycetota bacterium]|jgi:hypothetical protein